MKHNLMGKEKIENLGFDEVNSFENEEQRKRNLFRKLVEIDKMAERNIYKMRGETGVDGQPKDNNMYNV
jgi:hypothetical protein